MPIIRTPNGAIPYAVAQHKPAAKETVDYQAADVVGWQGGRVGVDTNKQGAGAALGLDMPWLQWPHEPANHYAMLRVFLSMGHTRRLDLVAMATGMVPRSINRLAGKYQWQVRATAFDAYSLDELAEQTRLARIDMSRRQAQTGAALLSAAYTAITHIDPLTIDANSAANLALTGTKIERLALGESTQNTAVKGGITIEWSGPQPKWAPQPAANSTRTTPSPLLTAGQDAATVDAEVEVP